MCFKENSSLFKLINILFIFINLGLLVATIFTLSQKTESEPYYELLITHDQTINVHLIYLPIIMNTFGLMFHSIFVLSHKYILERQFLNYSVNNFRWIHQFFTGCFGIVTIMAINGFDHIETFVISIIMYASIIALCFFQDQYLNSSYDFNPPKSPHVFAVPFYFIFIGFLMTKSMENIHSLPSVKLSIITTVSLILFGSTFSIQQLHYYTNKKLNVVHSEETVETEENKNETNSSKKNMENKVDELDRVIKKQRHDVMFDALYCVNIGLFQIIITWMVINLSLKNATLNSNNL